MTATYKQLTDFLVDLGLDTIGHTEKSYLAHVIGVYNDLKAWGCEEDVCRGGMFHSIYGTEVFQGFTLSVDRREEITEMIGPRAERLAYWNCAMDRQTFDSAVDRGEAPYWIRDRITDERVDLSAQDFDDLCRVHLCDWLEQVPRSKDWDYRPQVFDTMARRLGGIARTSFDQVFAAAE